MLLDGHACAHMKLAMMSQWPDPVPDFGLTECLDLSLQLLVADLKNLLNNGLCMVLVMCRGLTL